MPFFSPTTTDEAVDLLAASPLPLDSPTHHRYRGELHLLDTFGSGRRRPSWVWADRDDDGRVVGVVAALGSATGAPFVLDHLGVPDDPARAAAVIAHASAEARALGVEEACVWAPPGVGVDDPAVRLLSDPLRAAGWRLLVERRHYEFDPDPGLAAGAEAGVRLEQVTDAADPRLAAVHREVMRETLDAHDRAAIERVGFDEACREGLEYLVTADPVECLQLAIGAHGDVVGMISGRTMPTGRAFVLFVGVAHAYRGRHLGRRLLTWQTRRLLEQGATTLIADTDNENVPMARAFAEVGWPQTETRIDLV